MKPINQSMISVAAALEVRGYELIAIKALSTHPEDFDNKFILLARRSESNYVVWSCTVTDYGVDTYWGTYIDDYTKYKTDTEMFKAAIKVFNEK